MYTNPLVTLTETTSAISKDISPSRTVYILSQIIETIGYDEQYLADNVEEVSLSEQNDAIKALSEMIVGINSGKSYEESIIIALSLPEERAEEIGDEEAPIILVEDEKTSPLMQLSSVDELDDSSAIASYVFEEVSTFTEQEQTSLKLYQQDTEDIHQYVIPLILTRLIKEGSAIKNEDTKDLITRVYKSEKFTAILKATSEGEQLLTLDRNAPLKNEDATALEATRESSQLRFEIIINNITQQELEQIKIIALREAKKISQNERKQSELGE